MAMLWTIGELIMTCIDTAYFLFIPAFQLGYQKWVNKKYIVSYMMFYIIATTIYNNYTSNSVSVLFLTIALLIFYSIFFIQGKWSLKVFWLVFPLALLYGIELATFYFLVHVHKELNIDIFTLPNIYRLQMLALSKTLQISLMVFLLRTKLYLENFSYIVLFPVTIVSFMSIFFMSYGQLHNFTELDKSIAELILMRFTLVFLVVNLGYLLLITWLNKRHEKLLHQQQRLSDQQLQMQHMKLQQLLDQKLQLQQFELKMKNHKELAAVHEKFKIFQADVHENLRSLWSLINQTRKIAHFEKYLTQISQISQQFDKLYQTGDNVLDVVLSSKETIANLQHIQLQADIGLPPPNQFNSLDLGSILINLLDNAIEALRHLIPADGVERAIGLVMGIDGDYYTIEIVNPTNGREKRTQYDLTTLSSSQNPGLGLKIVKGLVDKYHGTLQVTHEDFFFTVLIQLPIDNSRSKEGYNAGEDCHMVNSLYAQ